MQWRLITLCVCVCVCVCVYVCIAMAFTGVWWWLLFPIGSGLLGILYGLISGCVTAILIGAIYSSIPYALPEDICVGLGIGQAIIICYFHVGRAAFVDHV